MARKITLDTLNKTFDEVKKLEDSIGFSETAISLGVSKDVLRRINNENNYKPHIKKSEWVPSFSKNEIVELRNKHSDDRSCMISNHSYYKHIDYYCINKDNKKNTKDSRKVTLESLGITKDEFISIRNKGMEYAKKRLNLAACTISILAAEHNILKNEKQNLEYFDLSADEFIKLYNNNSYIEIEEQIGMSEDIARREAKKLDILRSKHKTQDSIATKLSEIAAVTTNRRDIIENKEIDIVLNENIGIEYDGTMYHSIGLNKSSRFNRDVTPAENAKIQRHKTEWLKENKPDFQLFTIRENEYTDKNTRGIWYSIIRTKLGLNRKIFARKCHIKEIDTKTARDFLKHNHIQGYANCTIRYGLFYNDELIQAATFSKKTRFNEAAWELVRLGTIRGITVVGGASKLIKHFERNNKPKKLISYADMRWSKGNVYDVLGFKYMSKSQDYCYYKDGKIFSRQKFMKKNMKNIDGFIFDETKSEWENMKLNGYRYVSGVGQLKYEKIY